MRGSTPTPTTTKSHSSSRPSLVRTRSTAADSLERLDARPEQQLHAVVGVDVAVNGAQLGAQHPLQRNRRGLDDGHVEPALARRSGDLGADPSRSDHDDRAAAVQPRAQRVGVLDAAQVQHALQLAAGNREPARLGAGRQQQPVVAEPLAVVERHLGSPPCPRSPRCGPAAARSRARRRSPLRARRPARAVTPRAGSPWTAEAARTGARARRRSSPGGRRSPRPAASRPPLRRRGSRPRSRTSGRSSWPLLADDDPPMPTLLRVGSYVVADQAATSSAATGSPGSASVCERSSVARTASAPAPPASAKAASGPA